ncbi:MAG: methyl-accepting chemotaxis protein, partial [Pseudomonadota bacterium]
FGGVDWVLVAEEPAARALADIASLRWAILSAAGVVVLVAAVAAALLARGLSTPIRRMSDAVGKLASGELVEIPGQGRGDEIGALASSLGQIHHRAVEAQRFRTALDCSASATLVVAPDFRVVYANAAMTGVVERTPDFWRRVSPGVLADGLIGCNLTETLDVVRVLLDSLASGQAAAEAEAEFGDRVFTLTGAPVNDEHGERIGYAIQWREITDRRRMEREIARVISGVAEGDLTARIETVSEDPFLRDLADGVNRICGLIDDFTAELDRSVGALADGDLSERMSAGRGGRYGEVAERLNGALSALDRMVAGVRAAIAAVRDESRAVSENSGSLSERASSQAASLQQTSATMEQISNSVKSNADYAASASDLASDASTRAGRGKAVVNEAVGAMQRIESSSTRISDIISVIDGIAFQTNLLALNAAVEAARAGDAGKGFAVVASEVRTLAQRSAEAAKDIKGLIEESASHVGDGVRLVGDAGEVLEAMVSSVQQVSDGIVEISEGGQRQAEGVSEITVAMRQMDEITQANASMAEESAAAAKQLTGQADELSRLLAFFRGADAVVPTADGASDESAQDEAWRAAARPSTPSRAAGPQEQWAEF